MLNIRIVYVDHYLSKPISNLDPIKSPLNDESLSIVPVIRIFGTTSTGEKCCSHIHGFFPYLTVEKDAFSDYSIDALASELNRQLNEFYPSKDAARKDTNKIYNVEVIESRSFYGFRESTQQFLRFRFLNPRSVKLAFKIIKQGKLFGNRCNVYEAHITYIMQFFVNFKLAGMNYLNLENYHERKGDDRRMMSKDKQYFIRIEKQSVCELEIDIVLQNIIVKRNENKFINPGLVLVWQEEQRRLIESNKDIKGIFDSNLKDCGNRIYSKKSLELNYLQQLKDYLHYKDNYCSFYQNFNSPFDKMNRSFQSKDFLENLNQSLSQSVIEKIIESEKQMVGTTQFRQISSIGSNQMTKLNSKDICSPDFLRLIKNFKNYKSKNNSLNQMLEKIDVHSESESADSESDDELNLEKETRFTQLMLKARDTIIDQEEHSFHFSQQNDDQASRFTINENHLGTSSKELFRIEESMKSDATNEKRSDQSSQPVHSDSSSQIDANNFNLNDESLIGTPTTSCCDKSDGSRDLSLCSNDSRPLKRTCIFDDQIDIGHLVSLNDEPLFEDDDEDDAQLSSQSTCYQISQKSDRVISTSQKPLDQLSEALLSSQPHSDSQLDNKSIFSFYSLDSEEIQSDSQSSRSAEIENPSIKIANNHLAIEQHPQASTSTPVHDSLFKNQADKLRIRASLGTKFMKLSRDESSSRVQSPSLLQQLPAIQIHSPSDSMNKSNQSSQSRHYESSFTMNEKIQHLSESSIDCGSLMNKLTHESQNLTQLTMELFATTEHELKPNPLNDSIKMIFYMIHNDYVDELFTKQMSNGSVRQKHLIGIIIQEANIDIYNLDLNRTSQSTTENNSLNTFNQTTHRKKKPTALNNLLYFPDNDDVKVQYVNNELSLIEKFIEILVEHDPDIITGYEIETSSWGFLISRAELLRIDISMAFSRLLVDFNQANNKPPFQGPSNTDDAQKLNTRQTILNKTQCEEEDQFELSDQEEVIEVEEEEENKEVEQILNNNYLNRNKWDALEQCKRSRPDFGTIKTRQDLCDKVKDKPDLVRQYQSIFSLSWVSPCYMSLVGRIMLNLWRCIRKSELLLNSYTFENVYYHLFKRRRPYYSPKQLTEWYYSNNNFLRQNVLNYFLIRVKGNIEIIEKLGIVNSTSELARVFGIQFSDVISKGSQFRVESLLYRSTIEDNQFDVNKFESSSLEQNLNSNNSTPDLIKSKGKINFNKSIQSDMNLSRSINKFRSTERLSQKKELNVEVNRQKFMLLSCNFDDRLTQQDPVIIPFIMEPKHGFYTSNVAVLDFQSLYPSIMIAYNYCYSTCLGKLDYITNNLREFPLGFARLRVSTDFIKENVDNINISPNGILFCNQNIRKGILSNILEELLDTRLMVKKCLKMYSDENEKRIVKLLDARQLGLKLLANVTYGYTAASFSGRCPMIDLADSIISKARETLINSINFINNNSSEFGGEVIYGDTDSMFVEFKNTTREEAFKRAAKLCELITLSNPNPIKLKLEKVYSECVLLTKKHYAGYAFDSPEQKIPRFETKGIETIRRDTIGLVKRVLERSLRILFEKKSITEIRPYLESVFYKVIHENGENLHEYIYAKEYRGILGYRPKTYIPSMEISNRIVERYGEHCRPFTKERVPYVIGCTEINDRLVKMVQHPIEFLNNPALRINCTYYIDRVLIPPIQRVFGLLNVNIRHLYNDLPKKMFYLNTIEKQRFNLVQQASTNTLANYFNFVKCLICDRKIEQSHLQKSICGDCLQNSQSSVVSLLEELRLNEMNLNKATSRCLDCTKMNCIRTECQSIECDNLWLQNRLLNDHKLTQANYRTALDELGAQQRAKFTQVTK